MITPLTCVVVISGVSEAYGGDLAGIRGPARKRYSFCLRRNRERRKAIVSNNQSGPDHWQRIVGNLMTWSRTLNLLPRVVRIENGARNLRFMAIRIKGKCHVRFKYVGNLSEKWNLEEKSKLLKFLEIYDRWNRSLCFQGLLPWLRL